MVRVPRQVRLVPQTSPLVPGAPCRSGHRLFCRPGRQVSRDTPQLDAAISDPAGLSYRELLSIAGRLMATRLAVQIARLMVGSIYKGLISGQDDLLAPLTNPDTAVLILSLIHI